MKALVAAALVGVLHVHHEPSHDSDAPIDDVVAAAHEVGLDFVVLTDHYESDQDGPLPGGEHVGVHRDASGHEVLVLAGAEFGTSAGHLIGLRIPRAYANLDASGELMQARALIERMHADGGFALVPHPLTHGGWSDWAAPIDGIEIQNHASDFRRQLGPLVPIRVLRFLVDRQAGLGRMLVRPAGELELYDSLRTRGRDMVALAGADAHQNVSLLGARLDPYAQQFRPVQMWCPDGPLEAVHVLGVLLEGACAIRWSIYDDRAAEAHRVEFPSGRIEWVFGDGERVLEVRNPSRGEQQPHGELPPEPLRSSGGPRSP